MIEDKRREHLLLSFTHNFRKWALIYCGRNHIPGWVGVRVGIAEGQNYKGARGNSGSDGRAHLPNCGDGFLGVDIGQNFGIVHFK